MITITITIGRNVGTVPMDARTWRAALDDVRTSIYVAATNAGSIYVDAARGTGTWDGITESNATFVASIPAVNLDHIRGSLARIAGAYRQDAIALTVGTTDLITPAVTA